MDLFAQKRFATWAIALLVAINLLAVGTLWWTQVQHPRLPILPEEPNDPSGEMGELPDLLPFIAMEVGLSRSQREQIRALREEALPQIREQWKEMHSLRRQLNQGIFSDTTDPNQMQTWSQRIGELQAQLEWTKIEHLLDIKSICSPRQQRRLKALLEDVMQRTRPPGRPGRGSHRGPGGMGRGMGPGGPGRRGPGQRGMGLHPDGLDGPPPHPMHPPEGPGPEDL